MVKTGDLCKYIYLRIPPYWHLVAIVARMVGERAVRILLECFLLFIFLKLRVKYFIFSKPLTVSPINE